ncbi:MAG: hypothetical protein QOE70_4049 [Chthoniobacter sp.]|jgi:hypothetical protein|nr:hypothetical protein [Chthoniobacter sp.]
MSRPPVYLSPYADLDNGKLVSAEGSTIALPILTQGDSVVFSLRFLARVGDSPREKQINVRSLYASAGSIMAVPTGGTFTLLFDPEIGASSAETVELSMYSGIGSIESALATVGGETYTVLETKSPATGCWLIRFEQDDVPLALGTNSLSPESFVRIRSFEEGSLTWHEIRCMQAPLGFVSAFERVLGSAPSVTRAREGAQATDDAPASNELQNLLIPLEFRGAFFLRFEGRVTRLIGNGTGIVEIADALNAMWSDKLVRFDVSNVEARKALIEFTGPLAGDSRALITLTISAFEPGVCTFTLPLDRAACATALRTVPEVTVPLEIGIEYIDDDIAEEDWDTAPRRTLTLTQQSITIRRELVYDELAVRPVTDWQHPPQPRNYIPYTPDQIIHGERHYTESAFGDDDGEIRSFSIVHGLGSEQYAALVVRENVGGGRVLVLGVDYNILLVDDMEVSLTIPDGLAVPAIGDWTLVITAAGPASAFQVHTHTISQVVGDTEGALTLRAELDAISARVALIEDLVPSPQQIVRVDDVEAEAITIGDFLELFPGKSAPDAGLALPRPPALFPAIHDAVATSLTVLPLSDATAHAGEVFQNNTGATITLPGGFGRRTGTLINTGAYGSDGRSWYPLTRRGVTNSYFPRDYEKEFFRIGISSQMWALGDTFSLAFDVDLSLRKATTSMVFRVVIEAGAATQQATPSPVGLNLDAVVWSETPMLSQSILVGGTGAQVSYQHHFGVSIRRSLLDVLSGDKLIYRSWTAADDLPVAPTFALRARLVDADTENPVANAVGFVRVAMTGAAAQFS